MPTANEITREDPVIDFVFQKLRQDETTPSEAHVKETIGIALSTYYANTSKEHLVTPAKVDELYTLYVKKKESSGISNDSLSVLESLCKAYSTVQRKTEIKDQLKSELEKNGFKAVKSNDHCDYYNNYYRKISGDMMTYIIPHGLFATNNGQDTVMGTYVIKTPVKVADELEKILHGEITGSTTVNTIESVATGVILGGAVLAASIIGAINARDVNNYALEVLAVTGGVFISFFGGVLSGFGLHKYLSNKTQRQEYKKLGERIRPYLSPELSSDKLYDFNIIRKALE